ncbi:LysR family transcriptional regulator [Celerinatantimonas yamalensis]|uniref:LysR family transcriptional regulator n=1 Tax=Celerinatantimonas yamalensis TaxID=559956 RepID=A0ABW9G9S1_9GAMM
MDIDALRSFLAFVETGSFTRAAKQISRTQSALSAQMRKLEGEIGSTLFEKEGRHLVLSEAGVRLSSFATELVNHHDHALGQLRKFQGKNPLRLGCPEDYNETILPTIIQALKQSEPTCSIQIYNEPSIMLKQKLDEGVLDGAILTRTPGREEGYYLCSDHGVWIAAADEIIPLKGPLTLALFQSDCQYHAAAIDGLTKRGIRYQLLACCNSASAQRALVKQGLAIGAMGKLSVSEDLTVLSDMPPLPKVDIVLSVGAKPHPLLNLQFLNRLAPLFGSQKLDEQVSFTQNR